MLKQKQPQNVQYVYTQKEVESLIGEFLSKKEGLKIIPSIVIDEPYPNQFFIEIEEEKNSKEALEKLENWDGFSEVSGVFSGIFNTSSDKLSWESVTKENQIYVEVTMPMENYLSKEVITKPLTIEEMKNRINEDNYINGIVSVELSDLIDNDFENFLDIISEKLTNSPCLMDVSYEVVGSGNGDTIYIKVMGDITDIIDEN